jgi:Ser/Thr protein kinase RdoA (MazF antagonist)
MREKRGPLGRTVGAVAGSLASAARRGQAAALTRVVVYDAAGQASLLRPDSPEHAALAETAEKLIDLAREGRPRGRATPVEDPPDPA